MLWSCLDTGGAPGGSPRGPPRKRAARHRLPSRGSLGPRVPTFPTRSAPLPACGTLLHEDCHWPLSGAFGAPLPSPMPGGAALALCPLVSHGSWARRPPPRYAGSLPRDGRHAYACYSPRRPWGSPTFPRHPCERLPRSQPPVGACTLAVSHPGQRPSGHGTPSALASILLRLSGGPRLDRLRGSLTRPASSCPPASYAHSWGGTWRALLTGWRGVGQGGFAPCGAHPLGHNHQLHRIAPHAKVSGLPWHEQRLVRRGMRMLVAGGRETVRVTRT
jgi:hypothetical protein